LIFKTPQQIHSSSSSTDELGLVARGGDLPPGWQK
jgi:hypothetical protein